MVVSNVALADLETECPKTTEGLPQLSKEKFVQCVEYRFKKRGKAIPQNLELYHKLPQALDFLTKTCDQPYTYNNGIEVAKTYAGVPVYVWSCYALFSKPDQWGKSQRVTEPKKDESYVMIPHGLNIVWYRSTGTTKHIGVTAYGNNCGRWVDTTEPKDGKPATEREDYHPKACGRWGTDDGLQQPWKVE